MSRLPFQDCTSTCESDRCAESTVFLFVGRHMIKQRTPTWFTGTHFPPLLGRGRPHVHSDLSGIQGPPVHNASASAVPRIYLSPHQDTASGPCLDTRHLPVRWSHSDKEINPSQSCPDTRLAPRHVTSSRGSQPPDSRAPSRQDLSCAHPACSVVPTAASPPELVLVPSQPDGTSPQS